MVSLIPQERKKQTLKQYKSVTSKLLWLLFCSDVSFRADVDLP